jgi:hypothetical protein
MPIFDRRSIKDQVRVVELYMCNSSSIGFAAIE